MIAFTKMHGIGNDFVVIDAVADVAPASDLPALARAVNDRRFGIGGDGLIVVERGEAAPFRMRMFNPDGSESEMCGNGVRCVAKLVHERGHTASPVVRLETGAGVLGLELRADGRVRVDMGPARLTRGEIGMVGDSDDTFRERAVFIGGASLTGSAIGMGNPHLVLWVDQAASVPLETWGPELEHHPEFPQRVNVHFVEVLSPHAIVQRTWERGAGATLACGTGACASAVASFLGGRTGREVLVSLPGGDLEIEYREDGNVWMTGPAETAFEGVWLGGAV